MRRERHTSHALRQERHADMQSLSKIAPLRQERHVDIQPLSEIVPMRQERHVDMQPLFDELSEIVPMRQERRTSQALRQERHIHMSPLSEIWCGRNATPHTRCGRNATIAWLQLQGCGRNATSQSHGSRTLQTVIFARSPACPYWRFWRSPTAPSTTRKSRLLQLHSGDCYSFILALAGLLAARPAARERTTKNTHGDATTAQLADKARSRARAFFAAAFAAFASHCACNCQGSGWRI